MILSSSALIASKWMPGAAGSSVVAYPSAIPEQVVIETLESSGFETVIGASTLRVPLSDFSRVIDIPVRNALSRAPAGDPRRTPLLDRLESRFSIRGPDGAAWSVLYIHEGSASRNRSLPGTMDTLGTSYAIGLMRGTKGTGFLWLPVIVWLAWLVVRKSRGDRLVRIAGLLPWLPLLYGATTESAFLVLLLEWAAIMAKPFLDGGMSGALLARLAPIGISAIALIAMDAGMLPKLGITAGLLLLALALAPTIKAFSRREWLHEPPVFKPLTRKGAALGFRAVMVSAAFPSVAILVLSLAIPVEGGNDISGGAGFFIERGTEETKADEKNLTASHLAFQLALTYGRLGEAAWGESGYSDAYRYENVDGRIRRASGTGSPGLDGYENNPQDFRNLTFVLAEPPLLGISRR